MPKSSMPANAPGETAIIKNHQHIKPIIFSTPMVRALLRDEKTQTRRVVKPQPTFEVWRDGRPPNFWHWKDCQWADDGIGFPESGIADYAPYKTGDVLWVREKWGKTPYSICLYRGNYLDGRFEDIPTNTLIYRADFIDDEPTTPKLKFLPSIYMPRKFARIFLKVTNVRVERVRDISINDCIKEGIENVHGFRSEIRNWYSEFWDSLNAKRGYTWDSNPWVWMYEFERTEAAL